MKTNTLLTHTYTKRDIYGSVYHSVRVENPRNGKSFAVDAAGLEDVEGKLKEAFGGWDRARIQSTSTCTGSARISSLPAQDVTNYFNYDDYTNWKRELNKIGFRLPRKK
ncbi:MAG: hypothetical protein VW879_01860 [Opitutae bacterium]